MYQLFKIGFASATEYDIYRCTDDADDGIKLGRITMTSPTEYQADFDQVGLITDEERDSVWMLVEAAQDMIEYYPEIAYKSGCMFEVDI